MHAAAVEHVALNRKYQCGYRAKEADLFHVDLKRASRLTLWTNPRSNLFVLSLLKRSEYKIAFTTVIFDHVQLRQNPRRACHHSRRLNQLIQMQLPVIVKTTQNY